MLLISKLFMEHEKVTPQLQPSARCHWRTRISLMLFLRRNLLIFHPYNFHSPFLSQNHPRFSWNVDSKRLRFSADEKRIFVWGNFVEQQSSHIQTRKHFLGFSLFRSSTSVRMGERKGENQYEIFIYIFTMLLLLLIHFVCRARARGGLVVLVG